MTLENTVLQNDEQSGILLLPVAEHPKRIVEHIQITSAEYRLIQAIRAIRKKSICLIDVGGDGVPKTFRAIEACIVDLQKY